MRVYILGNKDLDSLLIRKLDKSEDYESIKQLRLINSKIYLLIKDVLKNIFIERYYPLLLKYNNKENKEDFCLESLYFSTVKYAKKLKSKFNIEYIPVKFECYDSKTIYFDIQNTSKDYQILKIKRWQMQMEIAKNKDIFNNIYIEYLDKIIQELEM